MTDPWLRPEELASWNPSWRRRWGILSNQLEDQGVAWPDHEQQAFDTIKTEKDIESLDNEPGLSKVEKPPMKQESSFSNPDWSKHR